MHKRTTKRHILITAAIVLTIVLGTALVVFVQTLKQQTIINKQTLADANFVIFYPGDTAKSNGTWQLQGNLTSYDKESGVLTLHAEQYGTGKQIVLNEQPTPGAFTDVPTQYSKMLTTLNEYNELQLGFGTVALTHPQELNGGQAAVANKAGTLIFAKPLTSLTDDEWQRFFESLRILR